MIFHVRYQTADKRNGLAKFPTKEAADRFCDTVERNTMGRVVHVDDKPQELKLGTHSKR